MNPTKRDLLVPVVLLSVLLHHAGSQTLHGINVIDVNCHGQEGKETVSMSLDALPEMTGNLPHVLTFFRAAPGAVTIRYKATDAKGKDIFSKRTVHLGHIPDKGKDSEVDGKHHADAAKKSSSKVSERRLGFRKSSLGGFRMRRRSAGFGSYGATSSRRRGLGVRKTAWHSGGAGFYSMTSSSAMRSRFPSGYVKTAYGFAGAGALVAGSSLGYPMAICAYGSINDCSSSMRTAQLTNALQVQNDEFKAEKGTKCQVGDWQGSCDKCFDTHPPYLCTTMMKPSGDIARDDIMDAAFVPYEYDSPLKLEITMIKGPDYAADKICKSKKKSAEEAKSSPDISMFVSISEVDALLDKDEDNPWDTKFGRWFAKVLVCLMCCCICCFCALLGLTWKMMNAQSE